MCLSPLTVLMAAEIPGSVFGKCDLNPQIYSRCTHTGEEKTWSIVLNVGRYSEYFFLGIKKKKTPWSRECQPGNSLWKDPRLWLIESSTNWKPMRQCSSTSLLWSGKYKTNNVPNQTNSYGVAEGRAIVWYYTGGTVGSRRLDFVLYLMVQVLEKTATGCGLQKNETRTEASWRQIYCRLSINRASR